MARYILCRRHILGLALALATFITLNGQSWIEARGVTATTRTEEAAAARLVSSDQAGIRLQLDTPDYTVDDSTGTIYAAGLSDIVQEAGAPALPYYSTLLLLPPEADAEVTVKTVGLERRTAAAIRPAPHPVLEVPTLDAAGTNTLYTSYEQNPAIYAAGEPYPTSTYRVSAPMYYRDLRLVRLDLFPLRYHPASQTLEHARRLEVMVTFSGAQPEQARPAGSSSGAADASIAPFILNYEDAQQWRSLPPVLDTATTQLPIGRDTFKIEVNEDGIYEIGRDELSNAGMVVGDVDPRTFEMMYRGEPVAYQLVNNNGDGTFDAGEKIRFYGWAFDGPRTEKQFLTNNVYWLWADGSPTLISPIESNNAAPVAESYEASVTRAPDLRYYDTLTTNWSIAPNEPDAWYWDRIIKLETIPSIVRSYEITLTAPTATGEVTTAVVTAELTNHEFDAEMDQLLHDVDIYVNGDTSHMGNTSWSGIRNVNITTTVPMTVLSEGVNTIQLQFNVDNQLAGAWYYLNRITVDYWREFEAQNEQLVFRDNEGPHSYQVTGFSNNTSAELIVWDISQRQSPQAVDNQDIQIDGTGPYSYGFGTSKPEAAFIATHAGNVKSPLAIEKYIPANIEPAGGGADWVAISYGDFIPTISQLASHRQNPTFGGHDTHIVDIEHVINQYGFGLPIPAAIQSYLKHGLQNWSLPPAYVLLVGDATVDPRQICTTDNTAICPWGKSDEINYVPTDLLFNDRLRAHVVSDYTYALLAGDDVIPDVAVGRIAVQSSAELSRVVEKIIGYETQHLNPQRWHKQALFLADNPDSAGDFCAANQAVGQHLPSNWSQNHLCLPDDSDNSVEAMQFAVSSAINTDGTTFLNYRGHGAIQEWAHQLGGSTAEPDGLGRWFNTDRPVIILSMDCHDGNFSRPNMPSLAEGLLKLERMGTVAHWSSTGLGWDFEHDILHRAFYDGIFEVGLTRMGDAINYSKIAYERTVYHDSQLYSFTLHGDPAMLTVRDFLFLPALQSD